MEDQIKTKQHKNNWIKKLISLYPDNVFTGAVADSLFPTKMLISFNPIEAVLIELFGVSLSSQTYLAIVQDHDSATVHHCIETMGDD